MAQKTFEKVAIECHFVPFLWHSHKTPGFRLAVDPLLSPERRRFCTRPRAIDRKEGKRSHMPRGLPKPAPQNPHNRQIAPVAPRRFVPQSVKNGARSPIWRVAGGWRQPASTNVKAGRLASCDPGPSAPSTAKWRFRPSEMRHFPPCLCPFSPSFLRERSQPGANWRESDS